MPSKATFYAASISVLMVVMITILVIGREVPVVESSEPSLVVTPVEVKGISADSYLVFDLESGQTIVAHNEEEARPIASVTKLFSAIAVLEQAPLEATTSITWSDVAAEGRAGKLEAFSEYSYRDLLWPLLLESSNDAAAALERVEPELIEEMNDFVKEKGALVTHFADASGLSAENISSAKELALLTQNMFYSSPHLFDITQLPQYIGEQAGWVNNSPFITEDEYRGGKHGYTYEADRTTVAIFEESVASDKKRLIGYVVLGSDDLKGDVASLRRQVVPAVSFQ